MKKLCVVIRVTRRDILPLLKETARPTDTSSIAEYNRANEDLYAMLFLLVELPASLCVQKHENDDVISGDGQAALRNSATPTTRLPTKSFVPPWRSS